jgi:mono/diheme cytochrome c family protein
MKSMIFTFSLLFSFSFLTMQGQELNNPWEVPDEYQEMSNPIDADKNSISEGKTLFKQHCKVCHGKAGEGDGYKAEKLQVNPSDLSLDDIDIQKDGELFYKIKTGRDEMHSYSVVLEENDIWNLVNYIRTLYPVEK